MTVDKNERDEIKRVMQHEIILCADGRVWLNPFCEYYEGRLFTTNKNWYFKSIAYDFKVTVEEVILIEKEMTEEYYKLYDVFNELHKNYCNKRDFLEDWETPYIAEETYKKKLREIEKLRPEINDVFKFSWNEEVENEQ